MYLCNFFNFFSEIKTAQYCSLFYDVFSDKSRKLDDIENVDATL